MFHAIIVDDDKWAIADIRNTFQLEKYGFEIAGEFQSAEDVIEAWPRLNPDLIITDICMVQKSGLDLIRFCRDHDSSALIIVISGYDKFDYVREALHQGVLDYLLKPLDDAEVSELMKRVSEIMKTRVPKRYTEDTLGKAIQYIEENYMHSISLEQLADRLYVNKSYLSELFSANAGMTFTQYKTNIRLKHAKELLLNSKKSVAEIAFQCGFNNSSRFSKVFLQAEGITPQQYRQGKNRRDRG